MLSNPASAARVFANGNDVYEWCIIAEKKPLCVAYVMAVADALNDKNPIAGWIACIPTEVTGQQVVDIAVRF